MGAAFVGRRTELDALTSLPRRARQAGTAAAGVVVAPPGGGKTRLLAELARRISPASIGHLVGYQPVQSVPLAAAGDLLRELGLSASEPDALRTFESAHQARIAAGLSVLLVDDLQWLDALSLGLVHYLLRAAASSHHPLVVIAAGRPSAEADSFSAGVATVLPPELLLIVELAPLAIGEGLALVTSLSPDLDERRATVLWQRAQGSPFWLEALALDPGDNRSGVISNRMAGLRVDAASLVSGLAVGGRPLVETELAGILDWPPERVRQAAEELVVRGIVISGGGGIRFAHDLIREMALDEVPPATARRMHRQFAAWIEALPGADLGLLREGLEHRVAAGMSTAELVLRLMASPDRRLLGAAGLHLIAGIADSLGHGSPHRERLAQGVAELASSLGEQKVAIEWWSRVSAQSRTSALRQRAELACAMAGYRLGRADLARTHVERARTASEPSTVDGQGDGSENDAMAIEIHALEAQIDLWLEHRTEEGAALATRAIESARAMAARTGGPRELTQAGMRAYLRALEAASDAATQQARMADLLPIAREIEQLAGLLDDDAISVEAITRVGSSLQEIGGSREATTVLRRAWILAKERVLPAESDEAGHWLARSLLSQGRLAEALAIARETAELEARLGHGSRHWGRADRIVHVIELSTGDPKAALAGLMDDAAREADRHLELGIRQTIAEWQARYSGTAATQEIDEQLAAARAASEEVACPRCAHELAIADAEIQARLGRIAEGEAALARWRTAPNMRQWAEGLWQYRAETALALARGESDAAATAARRAIAECLRFGNRRFEVWGLIDLGRALALQDRTAAVDAYRPAAIMAEQMGAGSEGRLIARELRRLGVRAWRRAPGDLRAATRADWVSPPRPLGGLSHREREIAGMVATGATNAEIAEALVISPKTVERHVTNIFAKLGIRNRAELTSLVRGSPDDLPGVAS